MKKYKQYLVYVSYLISEKITQCQKFNLSLLGREWSWQGKGNGPLNIEQKLAIELQGELRKKDEVWILSFSSPMMVRTKKAYHKPKLNWKLNRKEKTGHVRLKPYTLRLVAWFYFVLKTSLKLHYQLLLHFCR